MASNVVLIASPDPSKAYEAYTKLQQLSADGQIKLNSAGVVSRGPDGKLTLQDGGTANDGAGTLGGGLIGALIGILGGPLGVLLGLAGGALIGGASDASKDDDAFDLLDAVAVAIPPGGTALLAHVEEDSPAAIDGLAASEGAVVERWDAQTLFSDIQAAQKAEKADEKEARQVAKQAKKDLKDDANSAAQFEQTKQQQS